jgi:hypothetical protein
MRQPAPKLKLKSLKPKAFVLSLGGYSIAVGRRESMKRVRAEAAAQPPSN